MKRHLIKAIVGTLFLIMTFATAKANNITFPFYHGNGTYPGAPRQLRGDVNGDGERTVVDVTIIVNHILSHQGDFELWKGDMDCDGNITVVDVTIMVNIILGAQYDDPDNPDLNLDGPEGGDPGTGL